MQIFVFICDKSIAGAGILTDTLCYVPQLPHSGITSHNHFLHWFTRFMSPRVALFFWADTHNFMFLFSPVVLKGAIQWAIHSQVLKPQQPHTPGPFIEQKYLTGTFAEEQSLVDTSDLCLVNTVDRKMVKAQNVALKVRRSRGGLRFWRAQSTCSLQKPQRWFELFM